MVLVLVPVVPVPVLVSLVLELLSTSISQLLSHTLSTQLNST